MELIDFNQAGIKALLMEAFNHQAHVYFRTLPAPDPQYTIEEVANYLALDASTVRGYLKLPATHRRHLATVRCTDTGRGNRIRLSDVQAWQQRNVGSELDAKAAEPEALMAISHRRAAKREKRQAA